MSIFSKILGDAGKGLIDGIGGLVDRFVTTGDEKNQFKMEAAALIAARDAELEQTLRTELEAKARIIEAEMQQGDNYTKRARPTIVYSGLLFTLVQMVAPLFAVRIEVPDQFWPVWGGVCGLWIVGRSYERGARAKSNGQPANKLTKLITG
jgi:hypothetical protein